MHNRQNEMKGSINEPERKVWPIKIFQLQINNIHTELTFEKRETAGMFDCQYDLTAKNQNGTEYCRLTKPLGILFMHKLHAHQDNDVILMLEILNVSGQRIANLIRGESEERKIPKFHSGS